MAFITGDKQLDRNLQELSKTALGRVTRSATNKALTIIQKGMKSAVPPKYKELKKAIGKRFNKTKGGSNRGKLEAKVGVGVAMTKKKRAKFKRKDRGKKGGVGIQPENAHWFILGTGARQTKAGQSRGEMKPLIPNVIKDGYNATESRAAAVMIDALKAGIEREAKRLPK